MDKITGIFVAIVVLAAIAVIVSQNAQSAAVISAIGGSLSQSIGAAVAPVTGATASGVGVIP